MMGSIEVDTISVISSGTDAQVKEILTDFCNKNATVFKFSQLERQIKVGFVDAIFSKLNDVESFKDCHTSCLQCLRILSRDKKDLDVLTTHKILEILVKLSGLEHYAKQSGEVITIQEGNVAVIIESQKCLSNLIYNSPQAVQTCSENGAVNGILQRIKTYKDPQIVHDIKFFDMRILFLLTALNPQIRLEIVEQNHGLTSLTEVLQVTYHGSIDNSRPLTPLELDLMSEVLKILFNLTLGLPSNIIDEEVEANIIKLVGVLRDLLVCDKDQMMNKERHYELQSHVANLLINVPPQAFEELLTPVGVVGEQTEDTAEEKKTECDGRNMESILVLLDFLYRRLEDKSGGNLRESLTPILQLFCVACRSNRRIRKFSRRTVLPPLGKDVERLPHEGDSFRNCLCQLLTSPATDVKDLCAEFIFILCKENVNKMIKYTGYGNAAGLFANRGLLAGAHKKSTEYSSSSDDSDTEEYKDLENKINPVTGRVEDYLPPMEGMTDDQKEYEAMKLVEAIDKLQRHGIIQPSTIGEDGKPKPIESVLQLIDSIQPNQNEEGANSDD